MAVFACNTMTAYGYQRARGFFFNDTATTEIYTLSLHDALPILVTDAGIQIIGRNHMIRFIVAHNTIAEIDEACENQIGRAHV